MGHIKLVTGHGLVMTRLVTKASFDFLVFIFLEFCLPECAVFMTRYEKYFLVSFRRVYLVPKVLKVYFFKRSKTGVLFYLDTVLAIKKNFLNTAHFRYTH